jgi:hypothetical protein
MNAFERAQAGYDDDHERALVDAIIEAIAEASLISEPPAVCLRTGEIANALTRVLALILAMSPSAVRSPAAISKLTEEVHRRLTRGAANAARDPECMTSSHAPSATTTASAGQRMNRIREHELSALLCELDDACELIYDVHDSDIIKLSREDRARLLRVMDRAATYVDDLLRTIKESRGGRA